MRESLFLSGAAKGRLCRTTVVAGVMAWVASMPIAYATCPANLGPSTTPTSDFVVNSNGTVEHIPTGLMWKQCNEGLSGPGCATGTVSLVSWSSALTAARNSNFAGYTDWRLPNRKELESLVDNTCYSPAINETVFPATYANTTWTSTTPQGSPADAWTVSFASNLSFGFPKSSNYAVRLVRGGPRFGSLNVTGAAGTDRTVDAILITRYLMGFRGAALISGLSLTGTRTTAPLIEAYVENARFDVFARKLAGNPKAHADGLILLRLIAGVPDTALLNAVEVPADATHATGAAVRSYVNTRFNTSF